MIKRLTASGFLFFLCFALFAQEVEVTLVWDKLSGVHYTGIIQPPEQAGVVTQPLTSEIQETETLVTQTWKLNKLTAGRYKFFVSNIDMDNEFSDWASFSWNDYLAVSVKTPLLSQTLKPQVGNGALWYGFEIIGENLEIIPINQIVPRRGVVFGTTSDAATGFPVRSAQVNLVKDDAIKAKDQTSRSGLYLFYPSPGLYKIQATKSGYIPYEDQVDTRSSDLPRRQDINLCPVLHPQELRVVLSWNYYPQDLDLQISGKTAAGDDFLFSSKTNKGIAGKFFLEMTGDQGFDSESLSIQALPPGVFEISVSAPKNSQDSYGFSYSRARVCVYRGESLVKTYAIEPGWAGNLWKVFTLSGSTLELGDTAVSEPIEQEAPSEPASVLP